jgi:hypothetical protein
VPIVTQIQQLAIFIYGKTWVLYSSLIPPSGSRIALPQDKQLEIAHVEIY